MSTMNSINNVITGSVDGNNRQLIANDLSTVKVDFSNANLTVFNSSRGTEFAIFESGGTVANFIQVNGAPAGNSPLFTAVGSDLVIGMTFQTKSNGSFDFTSGTGTIMLLQSVTNPENSVTVTNSATGVSPTIAAVGTDPNVGIIIQSKGTASVNIPNAVINGVAITGTPSAGQVPIATSSSAASWASLASPQQVIYVALNGNDITGNGTFGNPYATISAAQTAITDNTPAKRYIIQCAVGSFALPPTLSPNIMFRGLGYQLTTFTGNANINSAAWNNSNDNRAYFEDCSITGVITFDCTAQASNTSAKLYFYTGRISSAPVFVANDAINQFIIQNSYLFAGLTASGGQIEINNTTNEGGSYTFNSTATIATSASINGGANLGSYAVNFTAAQQAVNLSLVGVGFIDSTTLALSGASATVTADSSSIPKWSNISYSSGASVSNLFSLNGVLPPVQGQATLTAGVATVSTPHIKGSNSNIFLTPQDSSSTGVPRITTKTANTSFVITSTNLSDTGVISYSLYP